MSFNLAVILSESARCAPDHPVAVFDGGQLTYRQLDQASDRVAANLPTAAPWVLLAHRGEPADGLVLRSLVPVSVRGPGEDGAITNRISAVLANLPVGEADPVWRLA
jgi:hypothetical protein